MATSPLSAKAVFDEAAEIASPDERRAYLDRTCADAPKLRQQVEALLAAYEQAGSFLEQPAMQSLATNDQPITASVGTVIGPYKLLEQIGEGGMGMVWMAQQTEPVKRVVALKLIKAGMDSKAVIARFEAERQALALMDHANIARVLDAGTTASGRPYFVMDLVKGVPITRYCDEHHLTPRQRLELFVPVCQAVQHAHQKGIIHRDLKPSNVLVALYDGKPVPKVIDFGVAKAAGQSLTEKTLVTGFGAVVGTLEYMSPEQAEINQLDIDTRSDIYSLGVLLYELLTGSPPFSRKELERAGMLEMLRVIREQEPSKPSTKLSTAEALPTLAANRGTEPAKLTKLVRGELDWIVMKALEKDRNRRYETANGFAMDVQRYLADEAVQACPPSVGYRLRKFARRNRAPVLAGSLVLTTLLLAIVGTTWGLLRALEAEANARAESAEKEKARMEALQEGKRAEEAKEDAKHERDVAIAAEADTKVFTDFLVQHFLAAGRPEGIGPGLGINITMAQALDAAEGNVEQAFAGRPRAEAKARQEIGMTWLHLARYDRAEMNLRRAIRLRERELGSHAQETLRSQFSLATVLQWSGRALEALPLIVETLRRQTMTLGGDHPDTLDTMNNLANAYQDLGPVDKAPPLLEAILAKQKALYPSDPDHPAILRTMNNLGMSYQQIGQMEKSLALFEQTFEKRKARLGPDQPNTLVTMSNLGLAYVIAGRPADGMPLVEEALSKMTSILGPKHRYTQQTSTGLGRLREIRKQELTYQQMQAAKGPSNLDTLSARHALARICRNVDLPSAEVHYQGVYETARQAWGAEHFQTLNSQCELGELLLRRGRFAEAEFHLRAWLVVQERKQRDDWLRFNIMSLLGDCLVGQEKYAAAEPLLIQGYEGLKQRASQIPSTNASNLTSALVRLVMAYRAWGKNDQAAEWQKKLDDQSANQLKTTTRSDPTVDPKR